MIESKLKAKNANSAVSTWLGLVSRVYHAQNRTTNTRTVVYKLCARGDADPDGLKFSCTPIDHCHTERVTMTQETTEFEMSCCLDKESEDRQNYPFTENMDKTM